MDSIYGCSTDRSDWVCCLRSPSPARLRVQAQKPQPPALFPRLGCDRTSSNTHFFGPGRLASLGQALRDPVLNLELAPESTPTNCHGSRKPPVARHAPDRCPAYADAMAHLTLPNQTVQTYRHLCRKYLFKNDLMEPLCHAARSRASACVILAVGAIWSEAAAPGPAAPAPTDLAPVAFRHRTNASCRRWP